MHCVAPRMSRVPRETKETTAEGGAPLRFKDKLAEEAAEGGPHIRASTYSPRRSPWHIISGGAPGCFNAPPERNPRRREPLRQRRRPPSDVQAKLTRLASAVADKYNLTLHAFTGEDESPSSITLSAGSTPGARAGDADVRRALSPYAVLSGTTRALYGTDVVMAPGIMTGNTDTRYYWDLSRHIFRFMPGWDPTRTSTCDPFQGIHTVDEKLSIRFHMRTCSGTPCSSVTWTRWT